MYNPLFMVQWRWGEHPRAFNWGLRGLKAHPFGGRTHTAEKIVFACRRQKEKYVRGEFLVFDGGKKLIYARANPWPTSGKLELLEFQSFAG